MNEEIVCVSVRTQNESKSKSKRGGKFNLVQLMASNTHEDPVLARAWQQAGCGSCGVWRRFGRRSVTVFRGGGHRILELVLEWPRRQAGVEDACETSVPGKPKRQP